MPRVDKWLFVDVQKHKRTAEYFGEGLGRKAGPRASGGKRAWMSEEREGANRRQGGARRSERSYA